MSGPRYRVLVRQHGRRDYRLSVEWVDPPTHRAGAPLAEPRSYPPIPDTRYRTLRRAYREARRWQWRPTAEREQAPVVAVIWPEGTAGPGG